MHVARAARGDASPLCNDPPRRQPSVRCANRNSSVAERSSSAARRYGCTQTLVNVQPLCGRKVSYFCYGPRRLQGAVQYRNEPEALSTERRRSGTVLKGGYLGAGGMLVHASWASVLFWIRNAIGLGFGCGIRGARAPASGGPDGSQVVGCPRASPATPQRDFFGSRAVSGRARSELRTRTRVPQRKLQPRGRSPGADA